MALEAEGGGQERLELERRAKAEAHSACTHYLKACPRYTLVQHLNDIGESPIITSHVRFHLCRLCFTCENRMTLLVKVC
jgi:hypothetical protein